MEKYSSILQIFVLCLTIAIVSVTASQQCGGPVCARKRGGGGEFKLFLGIGQCKKRFGSIGFELKKDTCCTNGCSKDYNPFCAMKKNGRKYQTFKSECDYARFCCENPNEKYDILHYGPCAPNCCPDSRLCFLRLTVKAPLCAVINGKECKDFVNLCLFQAEACRNPNKRYEFLHLGLCEKDCKQSLKKKCSG